MLIKKLFTILACMSLICCFVKNMKAQATQSSQADSSPSLVFINNTGVPDNQLILELLSPVPGQKGALQTRVPFQSSNHQIVEIKVPDNTVGFIIGREGYMNCQYWTNISFTGKHTYSVTIGESPSSYVYALPSAIFCTEITP